MKSATKKLKQVLAVYREIVIISRLLALADWDMQTYMPYRGAQGRALQIAYLTGLIADKWLDPQFKNTLEEILSMNLSIAEKAMVRNILQSGKLYFRVPKKLLAERAQITSEAVTVWRESRRQSKFALFRPYLEKIVSLNIQVARYLDKSADPYDPLIDQFEPDFTSAEASRLFKIIKKPLIKLHRSLSGFSPIIPMAGGVFAKEQQEKLASILMKVMGSLTGSSRLDESTHPFCTTLDNYDIRITTHYSPNDWRSSYSSVMHETGHALYEQGLPQQYFDTPLGQAASYGMHESQSRLWENQIGKSFGFIEFVTPTLARLFPAHFREKNENDIYRSLNALKNTPIRIEADEVAYNLHIILRFELEKELMNGRLTVDELPAAWNELSLKLLGVSPANDSEGVLQDIHWSYGNFGYFPTYTLGNLYAAQIFDKLVNLGILNGKIKKESLKNVLEFLRSNIHRHGSFYMPGKLIEVATGEPLNPDYFIQYLHNKYILK